MRLIWKNFWKNLWYDVLLHWRTDRVLKATFLLDMQLTAINTGLSDDLATLDWRRERLVRARTRLHHHLEKRKTP